MIITPKTIRNILFLISIVFSIPNHAQTFEGTIGKYPVFLELEIGYNDDLSTAFYFYKSQLKNISLEGTYNKSELILFEKFSDQKEGKELFNLFLDNDKLTGTWQNDGRLLQVELTKTTKNIDKYKSLKLEFVRDSISVYDKKELVWFTEKYSKKSLFRLGNGFTKSQREFMNPRLDSIHMEHAKTGLDCSWADIGIDIKLVSDQYISFSEYSSIYCGGAYPSHGIAGYNFDTKNNIQLRDLTDIYPKLDHYQLLKNKYENDSDLDIECEYFTGNEELWQYYSWMLTKSGVTIIPVYPHAMTPCKIEFELTYKELVKNN